MSYGLRESLNIEWKDVNLYNVLIRNVYYMFDFGFA